MQQNFYTQLEQYLNAEELKHIKLDGTIPGASIPIDSTYGFTKITFHIEPNLYFISIGERIGLNFVEGHSPEISDIVGDIRDILTAITAGNLQIQQHSLLGLKSYLPVGLDKRRFARTSTPKEWLIETFGRQTSMTALRIDTNQLEKEEEL